MTKKIIQLLLVLLFIGSPTFAQFVGFEDAIPQNFKCANAKELTLSTSFYKEGTKSLEWNFTPGSIIDVAREKPFTLDIQRETTDRFVALRVLFAFGKCVISVWISSAVCRLARLLDKL